MYDFLIVGAGLYGAVFARCVTDLGKKVLVIDRRDHIGGNCYTERIEGINAKPGAYIIWRSDKRISQCTTIFLSFFDLSNELIKTGR